MLRLSNIIAACCTVLVLNVSACVPQVDTFRENAGKHMREAEREKMLRTREENKLEGALYHLLRSAEQADTSAEQKLILHKRLKTERDLDADSLGRVRVILELRSLSDNTDVRQLVESNGGRVEEVGLVPYIRCKINPKNLRNLISAYQIERIRYSTPGSTK